MSSGFQMMKETYGHKRVFPYSEDLDEGGEIVHPGMSLREYAAIQAMKGLCASETADFSFSDERLVKVAISRADALLQALEETP